MIDIRDLAKAYDATQVLKGITLSMAKGGVTAIIGPNGAGKSTLLSIVGRLLAADSGTVTLDGDRLDNMPGHLAARRLSILRQDNHLTARLTVRDLVAFGRYPYSKGRYTAEDKVHVDKSIDFLGLTPFADRFLDELSGGQRQRAFIATVLCQDTDYVLLDEPLNNLDIKHAVAIMALVRKVASELGKTVVVVLHDINMASTYCDTIIVMKDGAVVEQGTASTVIRSALLSEVYETPVRVHDLEDRRVAIY